jgi:hypothetical protein
MSDSATPPKKTSKDESKELLGIKELIGSQKNVVNTMVQENENKRAQLEVIQSEANKAVSLIPTAFSMAANNWQFADKTEVSAAGHEINIVRQQ